MILLEDDSPERSPSSAHRPAGKHSSWWISATLKSNVQPETSQRLQMSCSRTPAEHMAVNGVKTAVAFKIKERNESNLSGVFTKIESD